MSLNLNNLHCLYKYMIVINEYSLRQQIAHDNHYYYYTVKITLLLYNICCSLSTVLDNNNIYNNGKQQ